MFVKLLMLFTLVPVVELYILIKAGQHIGTLNTIALIILTGIVGASFAKTQGAQIISKIRSTINRGQLPGRELLEGAMILVGGIMLVTPGFITDFLGLLLLFPWSRRLFAGLAAAYIKKKFQAGQWHFTTYSPSGETGKNDEETSRHPQLDD